MFQISDLQCFELLQTAFQSINQNVYHHIYFVLHLLTVIVFIICRFLVASLWFHLKLQTLRKTKNIHMVAFDLYLQATPFFSVSAF